MLNTSIDTSLLAACPDCDLLLQKKNIPLGNISRCPRCRTVLHTCISNSLQKTLALSLAGLVLFIPAMVMPIMTFTVKGLQGSGNVLDAMLGLFKNGYYFVGVMVFLVSFLFPFLKLGLLFVTTTALSCGYVSRTIIYMFRLQKHLSEWGMVEVYMLGILVSIIKMFSMADIAYNFGFFCFVGLVILTVWSSTTTDNYLFWNIIEEHQDKPAYPPASQKIPSLLPATAQQAGLIRCNDCGKLSFDLTDNQEGVVLRCPRCYAKLHGRKPGSLSRTWALVIAAAVLYIPANILPMMRVDFMGTPDDSTILDGIIYFFQTGDFLVGGIILTASVLVPLFKIIGIILILLSIRFKWNGWLQHKTTLFKFIEFVGRWSFLDVFVIALLGAMVQFGALTTIQADPAAPYFTAVVVCTMLAALSFDPRIMWDVGTTSNNIEA